MSGVPSHFMEWLGGYCRQRPVIRRVILFGSRARGDAGDRADIDLAFDVCGTDHAAWAEIQYAMTDEADTLLPVDAVRLDRAEGRFREHILTEGQVIYDARASG